jgi:DNA mismatch repair protein MSH4
MTMLYKAVGGAVQETHYGLALAGVVPLPPQVLADATYFSHKLERGLLQKKKTSANVIKERRRKLILDLKEHLVQAYNGTMEGELLTTWLKELQKEFVNRMTAIDAQARQSVEENSSAESGDDMEVDGYDDEEMMEGSVLDEGEVQDRSPSVITIDSRITSTGSSSTIRAPSTTISSVRAVSENEI